MDLKRISLGEIIAIVGGSLLGVGLFLKWYESSSRLATVAGQQKGKGTFSGWDVHTLIRYLFLAAAIAPLILAYIIARNHTLSWPRGQVTSVIAIAVSGLLVYNGVIDRPGEPASQIGLKYGWFVSMAGALLMLYGSVRRQQETEMKRKPPGTL